MIFFVAIATATPIPNGSLNQHSESRPLQYPVAARVSTNYASDPVGKLMSSLGRAHVTVDVTNPPSDNSYSTQSSYDSRSSLINSTPANVAPTSQVSPLVADVKRNNQGHPLKSFTVPAPPPPQSAPPIKIVSPLCNRQQAPNVASLSSSPCKKSLAAVMSSPAAANKTPARISAAAAAAANDMRSSEKLQPSYSTEELNQEMANLEGLMKDLNAITASEFGC